jgi:phosphohistidine phosphatase SixA
MIVLRHSDSCTEDASLKDHDRPLTAWGRSAAAALCERVVDAEWADPDLVLCSASTRSRETLAAMQAVHAPLRDATTVFMGSLYAVAAMDGVTADHLKETIVEWAEKAENETAAHGVTKRAVRTVLCVGHNKGWEEAAGDFTGERVSLKVANAALIECASDDDGSLTWAKAFDENASGWTLRAVLTHGLPDPGACEAGPGDGGGQSGGPGDDGSGDEAWGEGAPFPA